MSSQYRFFHDGKYLLAFGFLAVFMGNFGQSFFLGSYGASIQQALNLSASGYGLVYSIATLIAGTSLMIVGGYIDKLPLIRFTFFVAIGLLGGCLLFVVSDNIWLLGCAFFLVRLCGQGLLPHTGVTTMARCFDRHRGKGISIAASGVPVGEIILPLMATFLIAIVGWQKSWLIIAALVPFVFLPASYFLLAGARRAGFDFTPASIQQKNDGDMSQGRRAVLADGRFWRVLPALIAAPFVVTGIFIHQSFFILEKNWSMEVFAASFVGYGIVHWLSSLTAGVLVDRYSAVRLLPFYNVPLMLAMLVIAFVPGSVASFLMLGLMGMSIGCSGPVSGALWAEVYGTGKIGSIRSMTTSFGVWSTSLSPILFGVLIDGGTSVITLSIALAFAVLLACFSAAFSYRGS
ncbi:MFS transporter [Teredinibacter haidensis]|uniref:MFS transporter n=1 Tax=Teredinibacter haidensis TaxID=2731755 RepID=UPI000B0A6D1A|nr:MFS transporter [Teredinibacter haidensis]